MSFTIPHAFQFLGFSYHLVFVSCQIHKISRWYNTFHPQVMMFRKGGTSIASMLITSKITTNRRAHNPPVPSFPPASNTKGYWCFPLFKISFSKAACKTSFTPSSPPQPSHSSPASHQHTATPQASLAYHSSSASYSANSVYSPPTSPPSSSP